MAITADDDKVLTESGPTSREAGSATAPYVPKPVAVLKAEKRRRIAEIGYEIAQLSHERSVLKAELSK